MVLIVLIPRIDSISDRHFYQASWGLFLVAALVITSLFFRRFKKLSVVCRPYRDHFDRSRGVYRIAKPGIP